MNKTLNKLDLKNKIMIFSMPFILASIFYFLILENKINDLDVLEKTFKSISIDKNENLSIKINKLNNTIKENLELIENLDKSNSLYDYIKSRENENVSMSVNWNDLVKTIILNSHKNDIDIISLKNDINLKGKKRLKIVGKSSFLNIMENIRIIENLSRSISVEHFDYEEKDGEYLFKLHLNKSNSKRVINVL